MSVKDLRVPGRGPPPKASTKSGFSELLPGAPQIWIGRVLACNVVAVKAASLHTSGAVVGCEVRGTEGILLHPSCDVVELLDLVRIGELDSKVGEVSRRCAWDVLELRRSETVQAAAKSQTYGSSTSRSSSGRSPVSADTTAR